MPTGSFPTGRSSAHIVTFGLQKDEDLKHTRKSRPSLIAGASAHRATDGNIPSAQQAFPRPLLTLPKLGSRRMPRLQAGGELFVHSGADVSEQFLDLHQNLSQSVNKVTQEEHVSDVNLYTQIYLMSSFVPFQYLGRSIFWVLYTGSFNETSLFFSCEPTRSIERKHPASFLKETTALPKPNQQTAAQRHTSAFGCVLLRVTCKCDKSV